MSKRGRSRPPKSSRPALHAVSSTGEAVPIEYLPAPLRRFLLWPPLLLAVLVALFFWDSLFAGKVFCMRDTFFDFMPWRHFAHEAIRQGHWPLWNPYTNCGQPFMANPKSAVFYPPNVVFYVLPLTWALKFSLAAHVFLAAASAYLLARHWRLDAGPALLASTSYAFSTYMTAYLEFTSAIHTLAWCPVVLWLMSRWCQRWSELRDSRSPLVRFIGTLPAIFALALALAVQFLAGATQNFLYSLLLVAALGAAIAIAGPAISAEARRSAPRSSRGQVPASRRFECLGATVSAVLLAGGLALALALPQFLLTWELIPQSVRAREMDAGLHQASIHARHWLTAIVPFLYGRPGHLQQFWARSQAEFWVGTCYVGILPLMMASFAPLWFIRSQGGESFEQRRFLCLFFLTIGACGLVLAAGHYTPLYEFLFAHVPGFNRFRWPGKWLQWVAISLSILAGLGYQAIVDRTRNPQGEGRRLVWGIVAGWCAVLVLMTAGYDAARRGPKFFSWLIGGTFPVENHADLLQDYRVAILLLALSMIALLPYWFDGPLRRWAPAAVIALSFANLFYVSRQIHFIAPDDIYERVPQAIAARGASIAPERVHTNFARVQQGMYGCRDAELFLWAKEALVSETAATMGIFSDTGAATLELSRYRDMYSIYRSKSQEERDRLGDLLGIGYIVHGPLGMQVVRGVEPAMVKWTRREETLPRAVVVGRWHEIADPREAFKRVFNPDFDPAREAVVESPMSDALSSPESSARASAPAGRVTSLRYGPNRVEIEAQASAPALLVLSDPWYPGWHATVDGEPTPIVRANYLFRGVPLEYGRHRIEMTYWPWQIPVGITVSIATLLLMAAALVISRQRSVVRK